MNRKLIRPDLTEIKEKMSQEKDSAKRKMHPPTDTHAESYYYLKQMNKKTPVAVVLTDGEILKGSLEWYDRNCIKLTRLEEPNLLIYKANIKYIYKLEDEETTAKKRR